MQFQHSTEQFCEHTRGNFSARKAAHRCGRKPWQSKGHSPGQQEEMKAQVKSHQQLQHSIKADPFPLEQELYIIPSDRMSRIMDPQ